MSSSELTERPHLERWDVDRAAPSCRTRARVRRASSSTDPRRRPAGSAPARDELGDERVEVDPRSVRHVGGGREHPERREAERRDRAELDGVPGALPHGEPPRVGLDSASVGMRGATPPTSSIVTAGGSSPSPRRAATCGRRAAARARTSRAASPPSSAATERTIARAGRAGRTRRRGTVVSMIVDGRRDDPHAPRGVVPRAASVDVVDRTGGGDHFHVTVASAPSTGSRSSSSTGSSTARSRRRSPTARSTSSASRREGTRMTLRDQIQHVIDDEPVAIFMKGTPERPACGQLAAARSRRSGTPGAPITAVDVLPDPADPRRSSRRSPTGRRSRRCSSRAS